LWKEIFAITKRSREKVFKFTQIDFAPYTGVLNVEEHKPSLLFAGKVGSPLGGSPLVPT